MENYKIISWNVNGIRATIKKGFWQIMEEINPDIVCIQETKIDQELMKQLDVLNSEQFPFFYTHSCSSKKGYSGVATLSKTEAIYSEGGFNQKTYDIEGRVIQTKFPEFTLLNIYFPNGKQNTERLQYKLAFYERCLVFCNKLRAQGEKLVICGDYNTAHKPIDLHDPKSNENTSGFLPIERAWLDKLIAHDYVDTFREKNPDKTDCYTWWDMRTRARERNRGWRIDYFFISKDLLPNLKEAFILPEVIGSDHCPLGIELTFQYK